VQVLEVLLNMIAEVPYHLIDYKFIINLFVKTMEKSILVILAILGVATIGLYNLESFKSES
jgi:hypothetical protein